MKSYHEARWDRLVTAIAAYKQATEQVAHLRGDDRFREGRISALSDVLAVVTHIEAEECRHG